MDGILIYTIYEKPFATGKTLDEVRFKLPEGLSNVGRHTSDEPQIVESWL